MNERLFFISPYQICCVSLNVSFNLTLIYLFKTHDNSCAPDQVWRVIKD